MVLYLLFSEILTKRNLQKLVKAITLLETREVRLMGVRILKLDLESINFIIDRYNDESVAAWKLVDKWRGQVVKKWSEWGALQLLLSQAHGYKDLKMVDVCFEIINSDSVKRNLDVDIIIRTAEYFLNIDSAGKADQFLSDTRELHLRSGDTDFVTAMVIEILSSHEHLEDVINFFSETVQDFAQFTSQHPKYAKELQRLMKNVIQSKFYPYGQILSVYVDEDGFTMPDFYGESFLYYTNFMNSGNI